MSFGFILIGVLVDSEAKRRVAAAANTGVSTRSYRCQLVSSVLVLLQFMIPKFAIQAING